jgi:hypothetical protein
MLNKPAQLILFTCLGFLTGCTVYDDGGHHHHETYREPAPVVVREPAPVVVHEPPPVVVREPAPVYVEPEYDHSRRFDVSRHSQVVAEGHQKISFRVHNDGAVYVYDLHNGERILSQTLRDGDKFVFDPDHNQAHVNGHKVYDHDINSKHVYRIYFDNFGRGGRFERY